MSLNWLLSDVPFRFRIRQLHPRCVCKSCYDDHPHCVCKCRKCLISYKVHWKQFIRWVDGATVEEAWKKLPKANAFCTQLPIWTVLENNSKTLLRFFRERKRLVRQLLNGSNKLTRLLPTHIVENIAYHIYHTMKPVYHPYTYLIVAATEAIHSQKNIRPFVDRENKLIKLGVRDQIKYDKKRVKM